MPGCTTCSDENNDGTADRCEVCSSSKGLKGDKSGCVGK